ncbi:lectin-like protein [Leptotrombidium deliense]|uniref:Lectin-like protein n=1 Tax=Leptotrombidium deliense TaxID=299467 RepID=A0A443RX59_9ACAR|nr:lectin-like protein [Leptotrombidium deliense]
MQSMHFIIVQINGLCWTKNDDQSYHVATEKLTFPEAQKYCENLNATLVSIQSPEQNKFLRNLTNTFLSVKYKWLHETIWLNGQQTMAGSEHFKWLDGMPFNYTNWYPGNPDELQENYINCILMSFASGHWGDTNCYNQHGTLCVVRQKFSYFQLVFI